MGNVVSVISGGCLTVTTVILLFFYVKQYIDIHRKELGILKAMGYSRLKISVSFMMFGLSVMLGTTLGYAGSFLLMPSMYELMNKENLLPKIPVCFHPVTLIYFVVIPTCVFAFLAVLYAYIKLLKPALYLIRETEERTKKRREPKTGYTELPFLKMLRRDSVRSHKTLAFFVAFGAFCFSSMLQMSASMGELSSDMMGVIEFVIGLILAGTSLILSITTVVNSNAKQISLMKVFGYSFEECMSSILGGYRILSYLGFAIGTIYQYMLIKMTVQLYSSTDIVLPEVPFHFDTCLIVLTTYLICYEGLMYYFSRKIKRLPVKIVMME